VARSRCELKGSATVLAETESHLSDTTIWRIGREAVIRGVAEATPAHCGSGNSAGNSSRHLPDRDPFKKSVLDVLEAKSARPDEFTTDDACDGDSGRAGARQCRRRCIFNDGDHHTGFVIVLGSNQFRQVQNDREHRDCEQVFHSVAAVARPIRGMSSSVTPVIM